ncbi:MAG: dephospho-CoA kinase [Bacteroidales bacterium]|nr:dephospho-CoA kinase [Bacteroidales bacterium]
MIKAVGLTGSIASGKSTVANILEKLGYPVFYADDEAKKLYYNHQVAAKLKAEISTSFYKDANIPDLKKISDFIFSSPENATKVTNILYPFLTQTLLEWQEANDNKARYCFVEAAMLFESGWNNLFKKVVCVYCREIVRFERIKIRNGERAAEYINRAQFQMPDEQKNKLADFVIVNDGTRALLPQILLMLNALNECNG